MEGAVKEGVEDANWHRGGDEAGVEVSQCINGRERERFFISMI